MKILLTQLATLLLFSFMSVVSQANILAEGIWQTSINDQGKTKRLVITIERDNNFKLVAFMDFPDDGWMAIPAKIAIDSNDISLNFFTKLINGGLVNYSIASRSFYYLEISTATIFCEVGERIITS